MIRQSVTVLTLAGALAAQSIPAVPCPAPLQTNATSIFGVPLQMVAFDADRDLILDFAVRFADGSVRLAYAPEVLDAFVASPVVDARSIALLGGQHAPSGATGRDGFLVVDASGIAFVDLNGGTLQRHTIAATTAWNAATRLHCSEIGGAACVLALDPDLRTVRLGQVFGSTIVEAGTFLAADDVQEMLVFDPLQTGSPQVVVRTRSALQAWFANGAVAATFASPSPSTQGGLTTYRDGTLRKLAWVVLSGQQWLLRTYPSPSSPYVESVVDPGVHAPSRFRMVALHTLPTPAADTDALLVQQNSTQAQLVLTASGPGQFAAHSAFMQPGTTLSVDNCPGVCVDFDRDRAIDWAVTMTSTHCLQLQSGLAYAAQENPTAHFVTDVDYLPATCSIGLVDSVPTYEVNLRFETPPIDMDAEPQAWVQAVLWHQRVVDTTSTDHSENNCTRIVSTAQHVRYDLTPNGGGLLQQPGLLLTFTDPSPHEGVWVPNDHFYLMLRVVGLDGTEIVWSTDPAVYALVVDAVESDPLTDGELSFAFSVCDPQDPPVVPVTPATTGNRRVGVILKPRRLIPPISTLTVPAPGQASTGTTTTW